jgi:aldose 1-epimerase
METNYKQVKFYRGFDHNYVLKTTRDEVSLIARAKAANSGITMEVYTDLPGVQFYTAAGLNEKFHCKFGVTYKGFGGFCMETQYFPDAMNVEGFEKPILRAGDVYESTTVYKFLND